MQKVRNKAFTLIELIAVIVVLAVILAIAVPSIMSVVESSTKEAFKSDAKLVLDSIRVKLIDNPELDPTTVDETSIGTILGLSNENYNELNIQVNNGTTYIDVEGKGKWAGYSVCGTYFNIQLSEGSCANNFNNPVIMLLGNSELTINAGDTYIDAGATAFDVEDGDITGNIVVTGTVNPIAVGTYIMRYDVVDNAGRSAVTVMRTVNVIDTNNPTVTFGTSGNATYAKTRSTTVTVADSGGVDISSLKYQWNTSTNEPTEVSFTTLFTNVETISTPAGVTGGYYLWILAKDINNNTTITRTNVFNLDNTLPVITITGSSTVNLYQGGTYIDAGATASDDHSGINESVISTGTVNPSVAGTYYINYNVSDNAGNAAAQVTRTVNVLVQPMFNLTYGSAGNDYGNSIVQTADGSYIIIGSALTKFDSNGNLLWSKSYTGNSIALTSDGGYIITGSLSSDASAIKFDSNDNVMWSKSYGGSYSDYGTSIIQTSDGGYIVTGSLEDNYAHNVLIWKLNSAGDTSWTTTYNAPGACYDESGTEVIQTSDGGYAISGVQSIGGICSGNTGAYDTILLKLTSTGTISWNKTYLTYGRTDGGASLIQTSDGGYAIAASSGTGSDITDGNNGYRDILLLKLTSTGVKSWDKTYGGGNEDYGSSIIQTSDGGYIIQGNTASNNGDITDGNNGSYDAVILKTTSTGALSWNKTYGGSGFDMLNSIIITNDGGYATVGLTASNDGDITDGNSGSNDVWFMKFNSNFQY